MSLVSRPCRYDARSVPETTIRPRSRAIEQRRATRARRRRPRGNGRNHGVMLRHALAPFYPRGARARRRSRCRSARRRSSRRRRRRCRKRARPTSRSSCAARRSAPSRSRSPATADGWTIASTGRLGAPLDVVARRAAGALHRRLEAARVHARRHRARPGADDSHRRRRHDRDERRSRRAVSRSQKTDTIDAERAAAAAEHLLRPVRSARRAAEDGARPAARSRLYIVPQTVDRDRVGESSAEQIQTAGASDRRAPHAHHARAAGAARLDADLWTDDDRPDDPVQRAAAVARGRARGHRRGVVAQRHHLAAERRAGAASRATASRSPARCRGRRSRPRRALPGGRARRRQRPDRSRRASSPAFPIFGQIAGALADAGFIVVRYDKRGIGQSGGRAEAGDARRLRRRCARGGEAAGGSQGRRPETDRRRRPQRRRPRRADGGGEGQEDRGGRPARARRA